MGTDQRGHSMQPPDDELVGVDTAARFLGCSPTKVYQLGFNRMIQEPTLLGSGSDHRQDAGADRRGQLGPGFDHGG